MFTRQGRRTDPHGHSHSVELHEAASPYRHPRYDRPSATEKLIPLVPSASSGRKEKDDAHIQFECPGGADRCEPVQSGARLIWDKSWHHPSFQNAGGPFAIPFAVNQVTEIRLGPPTGLRNLTAPIM
jgi:hypothetical protein